MARVTSSTSTMIAPSAAVIQNDETFARFSTFVDQREQQHARERTEHAALAAVERDAADHGGREDLEDDSRRLTLVRRHRVDLAGGHQPGHRGEDAGEHPAADPDPVDLDAGRASRLDVAADRVHGAPGSVVAQPRTDADETATSIHAATGTPSQWCAPM